MSAVGIATVVSTAVACTGLVVGVMIVFAKTIMGHLAEHSRQLAEHGRQLAEINRALGRLEGRHDAEASAGRP
ncbi:MAG: hypothetical protein OXG47_08710 [bacterium]|nr:hypothetical protein [bacterium]MCY3924027.1 hypothetical protein [bacterium]